MEKFTIGVFIGAIVATVLIATVLAPDNIKRMEKEIKDLQIQVKQYKQDIKGKDFMTGVLIQQLKECK